MRTFPLTMADGTRRWNARLGLLLAVLCCLGRGGAGKLPRLHAHASARLGSDRVLRNDNATVAGKLAIVYLVPKHHNSSSFRRGQNSLLNLHLSIEQLFENVMGWQEPGRVDVLMFHTGDYTSSDLLQIKDRARQGALKTQGPHRERLLQRLDSDGTGGLLQLMLLHRTHWRLPPSLHQADVDGWQNPAASPYNSGYFNMLRFFGILVFKVTSVLGYDFVMRLDDDSFIQSPVQYDLAGFMESKGLDYAYRVSQTEGSSFTRGFPEALHLYITMHDIKPAFLYEHCNPQSLEGLLGGKWDAYAYYNNFFIARNALFTSPAVTHLLSYLDRVGGIYTQRWGDALIHAATVQMYVPKERVHGFTDWKYKHSWMVVPKGKRAHWNEKIYLEDVT